MIEHKFERDPGYYQNERPEIARLVDKEARVILDVGCGMGRLGARLKAEVPGRTIFGIEFEERVASQARNVLDGVLTGDIQTMQINFEPAMFDCIIFADILEHTLEPVSVLRKFKTVLKRGGTIICSIPNMRHYTVILQLLTRGWEYQEWGLFDQTHLRFFSLGSMKEMLTQAGFQVEYIEPRIIASKKMKLLNTICLSRLEEFLAFQYLIKARNVPSR